MQIARILHRAAGATAGAAMVITCASGVTAAAETSAQAGSADVVGSTAPTANEVQPMGLSQCKDLLEIRGYQVTLPRGLACQVAASADDRFPQLVAAAVAACFAALKATIVDTDTALWACTAAAV